MKLLFIHQNFPGQFKHLARYYAQHPGNEVRFLTKRKELEIPGVRKVLYQPKRQARATTHRYIREFENGVLHGQAVAEQAMALRQQGFVPDVIIAHPGWGEALYMKDVFPDVPLLNNFEFYYRGTGSDIGFEPGSEVTIDNLARVRTRNTVNLLSLDACDWGLSATYWQRQQYPKEFQSKISVIHEGVDTNAITPRSDVRIDLVRDGLSLTRTDEVITYVGRSLEPYRGFPSFMRAAEIICRRRPKAHFLVIGGDGVSYGSPLPNGRTYREKMLDEVDVDLDRFHFLGRIPYSVFVQVLQLSSAHIYLTYPFVLSWSMLEAMAAGALVIGSSTQPVEEVIKDGHNGLLADIFSPEQIADRVDEVLDHRDRMAGVRVAARATVLERYDLERVCLPRQKALIETLAGGGVPNESGSIQQTAASFSFA